MCIFVQVNTFLSRSVFLCQYSIFFVENHTYHKDHITENLIFKRTFLVSCFLFSCILWSYSAKLTLCDEFNTKCIINVLLALVDY